MTDRKPRIVASRHEANKISELLKTVLTERDDGFWEYAKGWDDHKVAKTVDERLSFRSVEKVRKDDYGHLYRVLPEALKVNHHKAPNYIELIARVTRLERIIEKLADDLGVEVPSRPSKPNGIHINP